MKETSGGVYYSPLGCHGEQVVRSKLSTYSSQGFGAPKLQRKAGSNLKKLLEVEGLGSLEGLTQNLDGNVVGYLRRWG